MFDFTFAWQIIIIITTVKWAELPLHYNSCCIMYSTIYTGDIYICSHINSVCCWFDGPWKDVFLFWLFASEDICVELLLGAVWTPPVIACCEAENLTCRLDTAPHRSKRSVRLLCLFWNSWLKCCWNKISVSSDSRNQLYLVEVNHLSGLLSGGTTADCCCRPADFFPN